MPRPNPTPQKKSRSITMALLGAVTLCSCCCCLAPNPNPPDEEVPAGDSGGSNFEGPQEVAADGTPVPGTATTTNQATQTKHTTHSRPFYGGPFWLPLFFGGMGGSNYRGSGGSGYNSPSRTQSPGAGAPAGGFGGTGRAMGGGTSGGSSSS